VIAATDPAAGPLTIAAPPSLAPATPKPARRTARRRWIVVAGGAAVALGLGAAALAYRASRPAGSAFRTVAVERADITQRVTATGTLLPVITSPVGAQVSGIVWKLHADYNSVVKAGQLLVELDPALFENAVAMATAQLAEAQASATGTRATAKGAQIVHDRTLNLVGQNLMSAGALDASEATLGEAAGTARSSTAQILQARAQLARAKLDLQHSIIRSPVDGTVISRNVDVGQAVAATLTAPTLFTIAQDLRHMQVHAAVDEADIGDVRPGQAATFTVDAFRDQAFRAVVREVRNAPQTAQNVVTYDVVLDADNLDGRLRPGMTASVIILIVQRTQVIAVANEALRYRPAGTAGAKAASPTASGPAVWVAEGDSAVRVAVKTGVTDGNLTEVDGLTLGREVIVDAARGAARPATTGGTGRGP